MTHHRAVISIALILLVVVAFPAVSASQTGRVEWDEPIVLFDADSGARVFSPLVVEDTEGDLKILWEVTTGTAAEATDLHNGIYCIDGDGVNWSQPIDVIVAPGGGRTFWPQHTLDAWGVLHLVWVGPNAQLYYGRVPSSEACQAGSWQTTAVVEAGQISNASIAVDAEGIVHIAYASRGANVFYMRSEDELPTSSTPVSVSPAVPGVATARPEIAVDGHGAIHVVWEEVELPDGYPGVRLLYARSTDGGRTWTEPLTIADGGHTQPNVAAMPDGTVHLLWNGRADVRGRYHQWSTDGGRSWSDVTEFVPKTWGGGQTGTPRFALDSADTLHVVTGTDDSAHAAWDGQQWSLPQVFADYDVFGNLEHQNITVSQGNTLHVVTKASSQRIVYVRGRSDSPETATAFEPLPSQPTLFPEAEEPGDTPTPVPSPVPTTLTSREPQPHHSESPIAPLLWAAGPALALVLGVMLVALGRARR